MIRIIFKFLLICLIVLLNFSLLFGREGSQHKFIPLVDVYKVNAPEDIPVSLKYPGRIKAFGKVTVVARVEGILQNKFFKEGSYVKKGDALYEIEDNIFMTNVKLSEAKLQEAIALYKNSKKNLKRVVSLYEDNATSEENRDNAYYNYEKSKSAVAFAKAELEKAKIILGYTKVKAPVSGFTSMKLVDVGNLVKNGTKLLEITENSPVYVEFSIPDADFTKYKLSKADKLLVDIEINGNIIEQNGIVNFRDINIDKDTSSVKLRAKFENKNQVLFPGEFVHVILKGIKIRNKVLIPQESVIQTQHGGIIFQVKKNKVIPLPIKTIYGFRNYFVVERGLKEGDFVIINNFFKIKPGAEVKIDKIKTFTR